MRSAFPFVSTGVFLLALGTASLVFADTPSDMSRESTHGVPAGRFDADLSRDAGQVLGDVAAARRALGRDEAGAARAGRELQSAERTLDHIRDQLCRTATRERAPSGGRLSDASEAGLALPDLIPIRTSFEALGREHSDPADPADSGGQEASRARDGDDALLYVEADLSRSGMRQGIRRAKAALADGDLDAADQALAAAEDDVVVVSIGIEAPLILARDAVQSALRDQTNGDVDSAKAELGESLGYLQKASEGADPVTRDSAAALTPQIRALLGRLGRGDAATTERLEWISQRVQVLSERSAERIGTGWQRMPSGHESTKDLIEAKLHLGDARIDHFYGHDDAAAEAELKAARAYLSVAASSMHGPAVPTLTDLIDQVAKLERSLDEGDVGQNGGQGLVRLEHRLADLIQGL